MVKNIYIREKGTISYYLTSDKDIRSMNLELNEKGELFMTGSITFSGLDYDYLVDKKINNVLNLEILYGDTDPIISNLSLAGDWSYQRRQVTLSLENDSNYTRFERILDREISKFGNTTEFDYESYIYNVWGIGAYQSNYEDFVTCSANPNPPNWVDGNIYNGYTDYGSGAIAGDSDVAVYHDDGTGFKKYLSITPGNDSEPSLTNPRWLYAPTMTTIGQERAAYQFDDAAKFSDLFSYWYKGNCTASSYTNSTRSYSIKGAFDEIFFQLDTEFSLSSNWLDYPISINPDYENTYIANTENTDTLTLSELINHIETLFNMTWRLDGNELIFKHWTELITPFTGVLPTEHNLLIREDIEDFKRASESDVFEHRLNFSKSDLGTHDDSVITYDNDFPDSNTLTGNFDVDFQFATNKGGKNTPVLLELSKIIVANPDFVPSLLHELFYLEGREYENGSLNGVDTVLVNTYSEESQFNAGDEYDILNFQMDKNCLLYWSFYSKFKSVVFTPFENKFIIKVAIRKLTNY